MATTVKKTVKRKPVRVVPASKAADKSVKLEAPYKAIGDRMRLARQRVPISQSKLAAQLGVTQNMLWRWENGRKLPRISNLVRLCQALQCSLDYLIVGREAAWKRRAS